VFRDRDEFACALEALDRRDFARAQSELDLLLECRSSGGLERAFLLNKRGVARMGLDQRELARADFEAALHAQSHYAPALTNLGNLLLESGRLQEAIDHYERAISSDGEYAIAFLNLGVAYKRAGRIAEGVRALRQAQRLEQRLRPSGRRYYRPSRPR
jgi:tetratricopeptide (TPR) repeat protein